MKCYYAHSLALYNTPAEARDINTLEKLGLEVLNPNAPEHQRGYNSMGMEYFFDLVRGCDVLAFHAMADGQIGAGCAGEIEAALAEDMPVIELPTAILKRTATIEETREYMRDMGAR